MRNLYGDTERLDGILHLRCSQSFDVLWTPRFAPSHVTVSYLGQRWRSRCQPRCALRKHLLQLATAVHLSPQRPFDAGRAPSPYATERTRHARQTRHRATLPVAKMMDAKTPC